ncbi:MAG: cobalt ECF transporter T component CbiQ [Spirochaetae bacterium HGW-Spirochaetae-5]|nr:MAG: cobalt ECF transporter T component CbiQ [Spirochaetae bacterium HGW-Spirochaetae-5]
MYLINRLSYSGSFKNVHPMEKFFFAMGALTLSLVTDNPVLMACMLFMMSFIIISAAGIKTADYIKLIFIPFVFILSGVLTIIIEINSQPAGYLWQREFAGVNFYVSEQSALSGGILFLRSFTSVSCLYFFILTTPITDVEYILKKMRLPALFREMFMMVYRFIFVTAEMAGMILISQRSRSGYSSFKNRLNSAGLLISSVFVKSYFFSSASYNAMLSRGCDGGIDVIESGYRYSVVNIFLIILFNLCFVILILRFG